MSGGMSPNGSQRRHILVAWWNAGSRACLGVARGQGLLIAGLHNGTPLASLIHEEVGATKTFQACFWFLQTA